MEEESSEDEEVLVSRGLYRLVSDIIGPEVEVKLRRERWKVYDLISSSRGNNINTVMSGSMAEGFEMKTSDLDVMLWSTDKIVVENYSQFIDYHPYYKTILMMDCDSTSPGFALVKCITRNDSDSSISSASVWKFNELWISSNLYVDFFSTPGDSPHGPCQSGEMLGGEYDKAHCLKCASWPTQAAPVISLMRRCGWPSEYVIQEIINDGCLLVPVASKRPLFEGASALEWRISFSLAEKRLMHSMNHSQFLCYGLWKLFLTEVIKTIKGIEDLLCSYFLKTIVFWEICRDATSWTTSNYISKFNNTLKMLISCVNSGNCPNFFIPDNNIFYGKVSGEKQQMLMSYLREFHSEGFRCLLRCQSLQNSLLPIINNHLLVRYISINEADYITDDSLKVMTLQYICRCNFAVFDIKGSVHELCKISRVNASSDFMSTVLAIRKRRLLQNMADLILQEMMQANSFWASNKVRHYYQKFAFNLLRDNNTYLGYSDLIIAKALYIHREYHRAIYVATVIKSKLQQQTITYDWAITEEHINMLQTHSLTFQTIIEQFVATFFQFYKDTSLHELYLEIIAHRESTWAAVLVIPPLVLANFLLILSHHKMNDMIHMYDVLRELHALVHHDDNFHIYSTHKAISWEILGICQQLCGEYPAAYNSYISALNDRYNYFKSATIARLNTLPTR